MSAETPARSQRRGGAGQRSRRRAPSPVALFREVPVAVEPGAAEYLPYDAITFPRLALKADKRGEAGLLQGLWMAGFMDHERQRQAGHQHRQALAQTALGGAGALPGAAAQVRKTRRQRSCAVCCVILLLQASRTAAAVGKAQQRARPQRGGEPPPHLSDRELARLAQVARAAAAPPPANVCCHSCAARAAPLWTVGR